MPPREDMSDGIIIMGASCGTYDCGAPRRLGEDMVCCLSVLNET